MAAVSLLFEHQAPLYQEFYFDDKERISPYEDYMFLEYVFRPGNLPEAYEFLRRSPYNRVEKQIERVETSFASSLDPSAAVNLLSSGDLIKVANPPKEWPEQMDSHVPITISQEFSCETLDTPENRLVKHLLELIHLMVISLLDSDDIHVGSYPRDRLKQFKNQVQEYLADDWLLEVGKFQYVPSNSQVLQKREGYRALYQYYLTLTLSYRLDWGEMRDLLKGYNRKLSELYEYWCYFKIIKVLSKMSGRIMKPAELFEVGKEKWSIRMKRGRRSTQPFDVVVDGKAIHVDLMYNPLFSKHTRDRSYSLPFKPDYTLLLGEDEETYFFIHFDAKYRSEGEVLDFYDKIGSRVKDEHIARLTEEREVRKRDNEEETMRKYKDGDVYKMHTYKDAILRTEGAYILYPGDRYKLFKVEEDTIIPSVGAFPLTPGKNGFEEDELESFLRAIISMELE
jgi:predicted component of viral defense system (DUF524 family)